MSQRNDDNMVVLLAGYSSVTAALARCLRRFACRVRRGRRRRLRRRRDRPTREARPKRVAIRWAAGGLFGIRAGGWKRDCRIAAVDPCRM
jgi:hypothetical protein